MDISHGTQVNELLRQERIGRNWRQHDLAEQLGTTVVTVKRWERGYQQPSSYFQVKLCTLFGKSAQELGLVEGSSSLSTTGQHDVAEVMPAHPAEKLALWTIPYLRNPHFTGRDDLLEQLDHHLSTHASDEPTSSRRAVLTQPEAIKGLGGIGKTQIAVEYAYRARVQERYTHTIWINAASEETILSSFAALAELIPSIAAQTETDQHELVSAILHWIEQCQDHWLLIFDNADDLSLVQQYFPMQGNGSLLLTTRAHAVGALASSLEVESMGIMEGNDFLLHRTQRQSSTEEESNEAANVVIALDGFPLALDQAGAYIEETGCSFADYLYLYHNHRYELLTRRGTLATHHPNPVATTWSLSFQQIEQTNPAAANLLRLCAFLAPDHIPEELLREGAPHWPPVLQEAVKDLFTFNQMLEDLLKFSLVKRLVEEHMLSIHRLVQVVQREQMDTEEQQHWAQRVVYGVNAVFPRDPHGDITTWPQCQRYLEQVQVCDLLIQQYQLGFSEAADVLNRTGIYLYEHGLYALAEPLYQRALCIWEQIAGPQTASPLNNLGDLYKEQGKYVQAEELYQRALQQVGPEHPQITYALNGLALIYKEQGKYTEAEPLYLQALRSREQLLGPEHPQVAYPLNNLAALYVEQGKYTKAEPLYLQALHIWEHQLGPEHPQIAYPLNNLANLYKELGKYAQAEPLSLRALHIREQQLGSEHPKIANPLNNLGEIYVEQGKYAQAKPLFLRALRTLEQQLGPDHGSVAFLLNNLAILSYYQGKYTEAEPLFLRALHIREHQLGPEHPQVAYPLNGLGDLYKEQGKYTEAKPLFLRALRVWERPSGPEHPLLAYPLNSLGDLYKKLGRYAEAESLFLRALHIREQQLGPDHSHVADVLNSLANLYLEQGRYKQARSLYQRALTLRQMNLTPQHPDIAETLHDLAHFHHLQRKLPEAFVLYRQAQVIREQVYGFQHPKTKETWSSLIQLMQEIY